MIRVLIADDHAIVRRGLREIVSATDDIEVAGEARDGFEAVEKVCAEHFDVVLLDLSMPGKGGLAALKEIRTLRPAQTVLILSIYPEDQYALRVLKSGAAGYLTKERSPEELIHAIRRVHEGGRYITEHLAEKLATLVSAGSIPERGHEVLSDREFQVLRGIASGRTIARIADELCLSAKTVSTYRSRVMQKMGFSTNADLMRYALQNGLVE